MKAKHVLWIFSALVAVVAMAAGVAVIIDRYFSEKVAKYEYVECDGEEVEEVE